MMEVTLQNIIISLSVLISIVISQSSEIYGLCGTSPNDKFTFIDDAENPFCFKFKNALTSDPWYQYYYFGTRVDTYTLVTLQGSNLGETNTDNTTLNWRVGADVGVQFEAGNLTSGTMLARYQDEDGKWWVFTQLSVVIILDEGKVDEVVWDSGCYACEDSNCIKGNCGIPINECQAGTNNCDFSAYVSWYGTDANGRYLLSAGQRLSQFQSVSAKSYYDYVSNNLETDQISF